ncbi:MAG: glycine cleavage system protein GcvH [Phycisphaeraceae bacterium]
MASPDDRRYLSSHEWHKLDGDTVTVGISQSAVDELTDVTFVDVSAEDKVTKGEAFGEIESVKATSELYAGVDGEVIETNQEVLDDPSIINTDPYDKGWILKIKPSDPSQLDDLLSAADYDKEAGAE